MKTTITNQVDREYLHVADLSLFLESIPAGAVGPRIKIKEIEGGNQRDPYTVGYWLTAEWED